MTGAVSTGDREQVGGTAAQWALETQRQKSCVHLGGTGPSAATWVNRMATVPVARVMWADVPVPPTQP
jgi:hypothetical protein